MGAAGRVPWIFKRGLGLPASRRSFDLRQLISFTILSSSPSANPETWRKTGRLKARKRRVLAVFAARGHMDIKMLDRKRFIAIKSILVFRGNTSL
jgi:hypothetical protein